LTNKWIREHETSKAEVSGLLAIADRDIEQSQTPGLGPEWRFDIAYNAVVQLATAALAVSGYRAERANKHMRVLECLEFTLGLDKTHVAFFDRCRRKRNTAVYEQVGAISDHEADEMIEVAKQLRDEFATWLPSEQPDLVP
jgi:hypothetical protein